MDEFDLIAKYFRPLSEGAAGAYQLLDDAATLTVPPGKELVITTDAIVSGTHFLPDDPIETVAQKLLRVNISDLAAKGAKPVGYLLTCIWPQGTPETMIAGFASGLARDQARFGMCLLGGDTAAGAGPAAFNITAMGLVAKGGMIKRGGAKPGDLVFVTGTIGDAGLGLRALKGNFINLSSVYRSFLVNRYRIPEPRLEFMLAAHGHISAAVDVSDGLIADAGHVADVSNCRIEIQAARVPLSDAATALGEASGGPAYLATAGDDYEVCFTAPQSAGPALEAAAAATRTRLSEIGRVVQGSGAELLAHDGRPIPLPRKGFSHF